MGITFGFGVDDVEMKMGSRYLQMQKMIQIEGGITGYAKNGKKMRKQIKKDIKKLKKQNDKIKSPTEIAKLIKITKNIS